MEVITFIFSSFWIFIGTACLLGIVLDGIANIVKAFRKDS